MNDVYSVIKMIPEGKVATYGQIGKLAGVSPRYVGYLLHNNPDPKTIPCHRVVNAKGELAKAFAFGGIKEHKRRLEKEGVGVTKNRVDLTQFGWRS